MNFGDCSKLEPRVPHFGRVAEASLSEVEVVSDWPTLREGIRDLSLGVYWNSRLCAQFRASQIATT
jgi:hypothetical protein